MLPEPHLPRPRLLPGSELSPVLVLEGGAGSGKSVLVAELAQRLGLTVVCASIGPHDSNTDALLARLHEGLRAQGLEDAATTLVPRDLHPRDLLAALLDHLRDGEPPVLLVIDHAHRLDHDASETLLHLAATIPGPHRLAVLSHRRDGTAGRLELLTAHTVSEDELAFTRREANELVERRMGLRLSRRQLAWLYETTAGRPLDLVLAARHLERIDDADERHDELDRLRFKPHTIGAIVAHLLARMSVRRRRSLARLAALPWVDTELADELTPHPAVLQTAIDAGVAQRHDDGRVTFAAPVRDELRLHGSPSRRTIQRTADHYLADGDVRGALWLLIDAGCQARAANRMLERPELCDTLQVTELADLVDALPDEVVATRPLLLLALARRWHVAGRPDLQRDVLEQIDALGDEVPPHLRTAVEAERLRDAVHDDPGPYADVQTRARTLLARTHPRHRDVAARLNETLGLIEARQAADGWQQRARAHLETAVELYRSAGEVWLAGLAGTLLATAVAAASGDHDDAAEMLDRAVADAGAEPLLTSLALAHRARVHARRGQLIRAQADLAEATRLARLLDDRDALAFVDDLATALRQSAEFARSPGDPASELAEIEIQALGGFTVFVDGEAVQLRQGVATRLVKLLAARGGRLHQHTVAESLWPSDDPTQVHGRIDSVRYRLGPAQQIVVRDGEFIDFVDGTRLDVAEFVAVAREALSTRRADGTIDLIAARTAVRHYGELLPGHDDEWVVHHRQRLRNRVLEITDALVETHLRADESDQAQHWAQLALEIEQPGTARHARLSELLGHDGTVTSVTSA